jgi:hypothetical protein
MNTQIINQAITRVQPHGVVSGFLFGAGLSYSVQTEKYWHIPLVLLFPAAYTGYQIFKNKQEIILFTHRNIRT